MIFAVCFVWCCRHVRSRVVECCSRGPREGGALSQRKLEVLARLAGTGHAYACVYCANFIVHVLAPSCGYIHLPRYTRVELCINDEWSVTWTLVSAFGHFSLGHEAECSTRSSHISGFGLEVIKVCQHRVRSLSTYR